MNKIEVLSPAGDFDCLVCAVNNGADAVYVGGSKFSARKSAANFSDEQLRQAVCYAHLYGVKVYVALNTLIHEHELEQVYDFIKYCCDIGVDSLIVQDLGVVYMIKRYFPKMPVHASTQMTIHNLHGAKFAKKIGFSRVVVSRELSFDDIANIIQNSGIETEVFAHGALCMCYSGQCLMSSLIGGRSGNRGACAQPCRLPYTICDNDKNISNESDRYYMSLKDLCTIDDIDRFIDCGVSSLKIEGRMKSREYVAIVTAVYNKYRNGGSVDPKDFNLLKNIFSRNGFTKGYLYKKAGADMLNLHKNNDNVYHDIQPEVHDFASNLIESKRFNSIDAYVSVKLNNIPYLTLKYGDICVTEYADAVVEKALKVATDKQRILEQINKTGSTAFVIKNIECDIDDDINISIKTLNELRRNAIFKLESEVLRRETVTYFPYDYKKINSPKNNYRYSASVNNICQAKTANEIGFDKIYISYETYCMDAEYFNKYNNVFCLMLPDIASDEYLDKCQNCGLDEFCISNISQLNLYADKKLSANYTMNIFNSQAQQILNEYGVNCVCMSPELNIKQLENSGCDIDREILVYGRIRLMTVKNCLVKSAKGKCSCADAVNYIKDRKGVYFPFFTNKFNCTNSIYNSVPVYMGDRIDELKNINASLYRFDFTDENQEEIKRIFKSFKSGTKLDDGSFTRGHYYRGVL